MKYTKRSLLSLALFSSGSIAFLPLAASQEDDQKEDIFELSPFEVKAEDSAGYRATSTLAGSRLKTELKDVASAISVITKEFLEDTGSTDINELLIYTTGTEAGGPGGNYSATSSALNQSSDRALRADPQSGNRVRGLARADVMRDYFLSLIPMDSYNTGRADIQRGANSILFGIGSPAGIVNSSLLQPGLGEDKKKLSFRFGRWGSNRFEFDFDKTLTDRLGVRITGMHEDVKYRQNPAFNQDKRLYGVVKWNPKVADSMYTSLKASYEKGDIQSNRPRINPPKDNLSVWFDPDALNKQVFSPLDGVRAYDAAAYPEEGDPDFVQNDGNWDNLYIGGMGRWGRNIGAIFEDVDSSVQGVDGLPPMIFRQGGPGMFGFDSFNRAASDPNHVANLRAGEDLSGFWRDQQLTDRSVFDYYNYLLDGPNKEEWRDFDGVNLSLIQTFFNDKVGVELSYDGQESSWGDAGSLGFNTYALQIDFNEYFPFTDDNGDPIPNPNFGRAYAASDGVDGDHNFREVETYRATAFAKFDFNDFSDSPNFLTKFLGSHTLTANFSSFKDYTDRRAMNVWAAGPEIQLYKDLTNPIPDGFPSERMAVLHYFGDSIDHLSSPAGANLPNIKAEHFPATSGQAIIWDATASDPAFVTAPSMTTFNYRDNRDVLYRSGRLGEETIDSSVFVWQGKFFNGHVAALAAWRHDEQEERSFVADTNPFNDQVDVLSPDYALPAAPTASETKGQPSYGLVLHSPDFINERLPLGMELSLSYNESSNFRPGQRVDMYAEPLPPESGLTKDWGLRIAMLENKLELKVFRFKTELKNAPVDYNFFWAGTNEQRVLNGLRQRSNSADLVNQWFGVEHPLGDAADADGDGIWDTGAYEAGNYDALPRRTGPLTSFGWGGRYPTGYGDGKWDGQTPQSVRDAWLGAQPAEAWVARLDPGIVSAFNIRQSNNPTRWQLTRPTGLFATGDIVSEGTEFEMVYNPARNWRMAFNASKTEVSQSAPGGNLLPWIELNRDRWFDGFDTPASNPGEQDGFADLAFFGNYNFTYGDQSNRNNLVQYEKIAALEGASNPEVREWRANFVTNYRFSEGRLKGLSLGGAVRWEDEVAIGFPTKVDPVLGRIFDVDNPIMGPSRTSYDFWAGYSRKIADDKVNWSVRLNVRDIFGSDELIPVAAQPDGSVASFRMPNPNVWSITNTFEF